MACPLSSLKFGSRVPAMDIILCIGSCGSASGANRFVQIGALTANFGATIRTILAPDAPEGAARETCRSEPPADPQPTTCVICLNAPPPKGMRNCHKRAETKKEHAARRQICSAKRGKACRRDNTRSHRISGECLRDIRKSQTSGTRRLDGATARYILSRHAAGADFSSSAMSGDPMSALFAKFP